MIDVARRNDDDPMEFDVSVEDGGTQTRHRVTMKRATFEELSHGKGSPEELVRASFEFLLEREPASAILSTFDVTVIERYFPEYREEIADYLA